jgi:hypothetical protein
MNFVNNWRHINFNKIQEKYNIEYYIYVHNLGGANAPSFFIT